MDIKRLQDSGDHLLQILQEKTDLVLTSKERFPFKINALSTGALVLMFASLLKTNPPQGIVDEMDRFVDESGNWALDNLQNANLTELEDFNFNATLPFTIAVMGAHIQAMHKGSFEFAELCQTLIDGAIPIADKLCETALVAGK